MVIKEALRYSALHDFVQSYRLHKFQRQWRKKNSDNFTEAKNVFEPNLVSVGKYTYGDLHIVSFNNIDCISIGNFCSIAQDVTFIINAEHNLNTFSTYPFKVKLLNLCAYEAGSKGNIIVDDDVWIGYASIILSGVHIGQGAVIAAGSVVTKDVPPYAIVGGAPARVIKNRFSAEIKNKLENYKIGYLSQENIKNNVDIMYEPLVTVNRCQEILMQINSSIFKD